MTHPTHVIESRHVFWVTSCFFFFFQSHAWDDSCAAWLRHLCGMTHSFEWRGSWICVIRLTHMCDMTRDVWYDSLTCVTWLIHMCDMTHSYVWHDSPWCSASPNEPLLSHSKWMSHVMHMCDMTRMTWHPYVWHDSHDVAHPYVWHDSFTCVTCLIHMCDMSHSYVRLIHLGTLLPQTSPYNDTRNPLLLQYPSVWHDSFICVTWRIHMYDSFWHHYHTRDPLLLQYPSVWHDSFTCATWRIHVCDMTHSHVWHDPITCVKWPIHMCDMIDSHVWHDSFICLTLFDTTIPLVTPFCCSAHLRDMTHSHVWQDASTRVTWLIHACEMTHSHVWNEMHDTYETWLIHTWHIWGWTPHCHIGQRDTPPSPLSSMLVSYGTQCAE